MSGELTPREMRAANYRIKRAAGWRCSTEGCSEVHGILVVQGADGLTTSCRAHIGRRKPEPGQWLERQEQEEALRGSR